MTRRKAGYIGKGPSSNNVESTGVWDIDDSRIEVSKDTWPGMANDDQYSDSVTLSLDADDLAGKNIFVDKSGRSHILNSVANITVSTTDKKTGNSSILFDGNTDLLYVPHSSDVHLSSDFTVEFYFKVFALKGYQGLFAKQHDVGDGRAIALLFETNSRIYLYCGNNGTWTIALDTGFTPLTGVWYHIAVMRKADQWGVYIDGSLISRTVSTFAPSIGGHTQPFYIGRYGNLSGATQTFGGYIDRFRITDGVARYMPSFTPPTAAFPDTVAGDQYFNQVELLLHMNGSNGSTTFVDSSKNAFSITPRGSAALSTAESKFGGASARFNRASSQFLDIPGASNALNLGLSDFTMEAWVFLNTYPTAAGYSSAYWIYGSGSVSSDIGCEWVIEPNQIRFNINAFSAPTVIGYHGLELNKWHHVAVVRQGYSFGMFVDGECVAIGYSTATATTPVNGVAISAAEPTGGSTAGNFDGFIDEFRITKGVARYGLTFTPSTKYIRSIPSKAGDPYFNTTQLLLHMNGADNGNTFIDSSNNPGKVLSNGGRLAVTPVGDARLSQTQSKFGGTSAFFDGTGDCLRISNTNSNFVFGTGDFTIEAWVYTTTLSSYGAILVYANGSTTNSNYGFQMLRNGSTWQFEIISGTTQYGGTAGTVPINQWVHVAMVRSGNNLYAFADGQLIKTTSVTGITPNEPSGAILEIGQSYNGSYYWNGFIDDLRITKGVARYTSTFTPPTSANPTTAAGDPYFYNTVLLMPMNNVSGSHSFVDLSPGVPTLTAQKVFGTSSAYFDGINGNIAIEYNTGFGLSTTDFTVEGWFYFTNLNTTLRNLIQLGDGANTSGPIYTGWGLSYLGSEGSNQIKFTRYDGTQRDYVTTGLSMSANTWYHIAVCRINSILYIFVNGVAYYAASNTQSFDAVNTNPLRLGLGYYGPQAAYAGPRYWPGYMDEVRVTRGVGRYIPRFQPPRSRVGSDANTSLLLRMEGTNDGTVFTDSSPNALTVTAFGNARTRQAQFKFGASSGFFDGTGDYLTTPTSSLFAFGTGDFTIEMWIYRVGSGQQHLYEGRNGTTTNTILFYLASDNSLTYYANGANRITTSAIPSTNAWHHIALARKSGITSIYMDGILVGLAADTVSIAAPSTSVIVGANDVTTGGYFSGYIDDLRVSKGVARYDASFTPPTSQFLDYYRPTSDPYGPQVALLLRGDGKHLSPMAKDLSTHALALLPGAWSGIPAHDIYVKKFGTSSLKYLNTDHKLVMTPALSLAGSSADFTLEFWINIQGRPPSNGSAWIFSQAPATNCPILIHQNASTSRLVLYSSSNGTSWNLASDQPIVDAIRSSWNHIAVCRTGGYLVIYWNGVASTLLNLSTTQFTTNTGDLTIGSAGNNNTLNTLNGWIDDLRFTKGVSRYLASPSFTPSSTAFTDPTVIKSEPLADKVATLLHMGVEAEGRRFTYDSSIYKLTPVMYGNARTSTVQAKFGTSSLYCDGINSYLELGTESTFTLGTNDFTVEMWLYPNQIRTGAIISDQYTGAGDTIAITIGLANGLDSATGTNVWFGYYNGSAWSGLVSNESISASTWTHIALNRRNGVLTIYKDGVAIGSSIFSTSLPALTNLWLGRRWDLYTQSALYYDGYIDEFRYTNGTARYGQAFTLPSSQSTSDSYTSLLLCMNGTNGSTTFTDSSSNLASITVNGNSQISTAQSVFGGSSGYFDGTGDYLTTPDSANYDFGSGDFTIEAWIYPVAAVNCSIVSKQRNATLAAYGEYAFEMTSGRNIKFSATTGGEQAGSWNLVALTSQSLVALNQWSHIAVTRKNSIFYIYINGLLDASISATGAITNGTAALTIGALRDDGTWPFNGYIDEVRISKGIARYDINFTPSATAFTDPVITLSERFADKVSLLMHMNGANNAQVFTDSSTSNIRIDAGGTVKTSTAQSKFGSSSALFDGSSSFLELFPGTATALGAGSFTIELWAYFNSISTHMYFMDARNTGQQTNWAFIWRSPNGTGTLNSLEWFNGSASTNRSWVPTLNTWHHIAIVRTFTVCQFYVDGNPIGTPFSDTTNYTVSANASYIGTRFNGDEKFNGYIDEFRITKEARYPEPFTPPTSAHPLP